MNNTIIITAVRFPIVFEDGSRDHITLSKEQVEAAKLVGYPIASVVKDFLGDKPIKYVMKPTTKEIEMNLEEGWKAMEVIESGELDK